MRVCPRQSRLYQLQHVYTFGEPRVGNPTYAATYAKVVQAYRVVHYADIVPHLPLSAMGFQHSPIEV